MVEFGVDFEVNRVWIFPSLRFLMRPCAFFARMTFFFTLRFWHCAGLLHGVDIPARSSALQRAQARSSALKRAPACSSALQRTPAHLLFAQSPMPVRRAKPSARAFASGSAGALPSVSAISSVQAPCVDNRARRAISLADRGVAQRWLLWGSCSQQWIEAYTQMSRAVAAVGSAWFARWEGGRGTRIPIVDGASRPRGQQGARFLEIPIFLSTQTVSFWADLTSPVSWFSDCSQLTFVRCSRHFVSGKRRSSSA